MIGRLVLEVLFRKSGLRKAGHRVHIPSGRAVTIARMFANNHRNNRPLLHNMENYDVYSDIELSRPGEHIEGNRYFRQLDEQYPGSRFVLNTRDKDNWLKSRCNHGEGRYLEKYMSATNQDDVGAVLKDWAEQWDAHHASVKTHFKDRPEQLLVFDIEKDTAEKIVEFLPEYKIDPTHWQNANKTRFANTRHV